MTDAVQLEAEAAAFLAANPWLLDGERVLNQCLHVSCCWAEILGAAGLLRSGRCGWPVLSFQIYGHQPCPEFYGAGWCQRGITTHYVLRVGDQCWDWTARQFDTALPVPLVWPVSRARRVHRRGGRWRAANGGER